MNRVCVKENAMHPRSAIGFLIIQSYCREEMHLKQPPCLKREGERSI